MKDQKRFKITLIKVIFIKSLVIECILNDTLLEAVWRYARQTLSPKIDVCKSKTLVIQ